MKALHLCKALFISVIRIGLVHFPQADAQAAHDPIL